jgi:hypothetical protein
VIPERYIELIQQEIDGCNTPAQSAELRAYLEKHPEGLRCFNELNELSRSFGKMGQVEPPPELRALILERIAAVDGMRRTAADQRDPGGEPWAGIRTHVPSHGGARRTSRWNLGFTLAAFAAGVVVGIFVLGALLRIHPGTSPSALEELYGTMISRSGNKGLVETFPFDGGEVALTGSATVRTDGERVMTDLELQCPESVQVVFEYGDGARFEGVQTLKGDHYTINSTNGSTSLHLGETAHVAVFLTRTDRAPVHLSMKILSGENTVFQKTILSERN